MLKLKQKYIGTIEFYKYVISLALPMILQSILTTFVNMIDNIMVGKIGTLQLAGVSIANQWTFVYNVTVFGGLAGASIFGTQYYGSRDEEGQRWTLRFRIYMAILIIVVGMLLFYTFDKQLISLFLAKENDYYQNQMTLQYGIDYIKIVTIGLIPFAFGQVYASLVRECEKTTIPMFASLLAIFVNVFLDYVLIFGKLGMPMLGVQGAAIATVIAKTIEALVIIIWTHRNTKIIECAKNVFSSFVIPVDLVKSIIKKSFPLLINEFLWAFGMILVARAYSLRGLEVVAARNIAYTITDIFTVVYVQLGACIGIIVGIKLGAELFDEAKDTSNKLLFFSVCVSIIMAIIIIPLAYIYPSIYNVEKSIKELATFYIIVQAFAMPLWAYTNGCYFILRSGGKTGITFLFDCVYTWILWIPFAYYLTLWTKIDIRVIMVILTNAEIVKVIVGYFLVKSNIWMQNIIKS